MTKYSVSVFDGKSWEGIALFADRVDFDAMVNFCVEQFQNGNSITTPAENIHIADLETGEILWDWRQDFDPRNDPADWDYNEDCGFDPYMGCYTDDC